MGKPYSVDLRKRVVAGGRGLKVDYHSVWDFVHAEKLSFKKAWRLANAIVQRSRGAEPSVQSIKTASKLSGWSSSTRPGRGPIWPPAPRGSRLHAKVPHGRWKTMTFPGGIAL